jgi:hypothetical protein
MCDFHDPLLCDGCGLRETRERPGKLDAHSGRVRRSCPASAATAPVPVYCT